MPYTRTWSDLLVLATKLYKNIPITANDALICDMVSAKMWNAWPWQERIQNIPAPGELLVHGQQDYSTPVAIHKLIRARITRTDVTPDVSWPLDVTEHLEPNLVNQSASSIRMISHEPDLGQLRLDSSIQVTSPAVYRLNGEYEIQHTKITATSQGCWFKDQFDEVAIKGLAYWGYRIGDETAKAGTSTTDGEGRVTYTGMLGEWMAGIEEMRRVEDFGALPQLFPDDSLGASQFSGLGIFP